MDNKLNIVEKISLINIYFFVLLMTTPIFYWKGAEIQYLIFFIIFIFTGAYITNYRIPVDSLTISVVIWLSFVLVYRIVNYSTATFFVYAQIFLFWFTYIVFIFSDKYLKFSTRKRIASVSVVIFLVNIIQNSIILRMYPNASRQITKASIYYDQFRNLNIGSTSFVFAACLLIFVFLGFILRNKSKIYRSVYFLITLFLVYFQFQCARATSVLLMIAGLILFIFLYYTKKSNLFCKNIIIAIIIVPFIILMYFSSFKILINLSNMSSNTYLSSRLFGLANYINYGYDDIGVVQGRYDVYLKSLRAFVINPIFGIGEHDQFSRTIEVGYHSEILDIIGKYGFTGILFWGMFFFTYYKKLILREKNKNNQIILITTAILFITYSLLNRVVAHDAIPIMIFLIIPFSFSSNRSVNNNGLN